MKQPPKFIGFTEHKRDRLILCNAAYDLDKSGWAETATKSSLAWSRGKNCGRQLFSLQKANQAFVDKCLGCTPTKFML